MIDITLDDINTADLEKMPSHGHTSTSSNLKNNITKAETNPSQRDNTIFDYLSKTIVKPVEFTPSIKLDTNVSSIVTSQPTSREKTHNNDKLFKKIRVLESVKILYLHKVIDAYGVIDELTRDNDSYQINARIYDVHTNEIIDTISFSSTEFSKSDRKKLIENAIFYWVVGRGKTILGVEKRISEFRLRRIYISDSNNL